MSEETIKMIKEKLKCIEERHARIMKTQEEIHLSSYQLMGSLSFLLARMRFRLYLKDIFSENDVKNVPKRRLTI